MKTKTQLQIAGALWSLSFLLGVLFFGVLSAAINAPWWWASFVTVLEFFAHISMNPGDLPALFTNPLNQEMMFIYTGLPAFAAWVWTLSLIVRSDDRRGKWLEALLVFSFIPILALIAISRLLGKSASAESVNDDVPDGAVVE